MKTRQEKKIIIIAGPNGAGKTTFAEEFLPKEANCPIFVNADLIAAGLAPFDPDRAAFKAGRLMLTEITEHARRGESFSFEITLSGRGYARLIPVWRADGYLVKLFFLRLASAGARHCPRTPAGSRGRPQCAGSDYPSPVSGRLAQF